MGRQRLITSLLLSTGLMAGAFAWADNSAELKNVQGQIASQRQDVQQQQQQVKELQQQLAKDEKAISALARELNQTRNRLTELEVNLARLDREHRELNQQSERQQRLLAEQLRAAYQNGRHDYLKLLLNGQDSTDIDRLLHYYAHLNQARADALKELARTREQLADNRRQAEQSRQQLNQLLARQQGEQQKLNDQQAKRSDTLKKLNANLEQGNQRLTSLQQAANQLERQIKAAQERAAREQAAREKAERERLERERLARERAAQQTAGGQPSASGRTPVVAKPSGNFGGLAKGSLPWPLNGQLVHRFGAARTSQLSWKGLLIGAGVGQEVKAVANGQVVYADWLNGFGMVMVIDHGKGYMSLYGHNQSLLQGPGDRVSAGQAIALSGESGGQSRSGLYFEIRYQGQAIDPLPWLARR
ncbi:murein hydrolase activator EnvC [Zobellella sp. DQSA1]|uniref:murein hydrolase activator EnvC n=1 Tax=Zobellella sp. DQSA1 TaxID=3342386 RepID=UPI0035C0812B